MRQEKVNALCFGSGFAFCQGKHGKECRPSSGRINQVTKEVQAWTG